MQDSDPVHNRGTVRAMQHAVIGGSLDVALLVDLFLLYGICLVSACLNTV